MSKSHGKPRVDDRRMLSGIIVVNRNSLRRRDAPSAYGPHKTLHNRWKQWGAMGVFIRMVEGLSAQAVIAENVHTLGRQMEKLMINPVTGAAGICPALLGADPFGNGVPIPAMKGRKRCRMHGGMNPGAPESNSIARKHGGRLASAMAAAIWTMPRKPLAN